MLGLASGSDPSIGVPSATHGHGVNEQREGPPCLTGRAERVREHFRPGWIAAIHRKLLGCDDPVARR